MNSTIEWLKYHRSEWLDSIDLMEKGIMRTGDMREGKATDTTIETIERYKKWVTDADKLIADHEAMGRNESNGG